MKINLNIDFDDLAMACIVLKDALDSKQWKDEEQIKQIFNLFKTTIERSVLDVAKCKK